MRTQRIKLYKFSELSEQAKQTALEDYANQTEYFWNDDSIKSLTWFVEHFGATLADYSIDWLEYYRSSVRFDVPDEEYTKAKLKALIMSMGAFDKKTMKGLGDCKFTGYCADEDAADGARKAYFEGERDLKAILKAGFETWHKAATQDFEHQLSAEGYAEHCETNNYEFTENGKLF